VSQLTHVGRWVLCGSEEQVLAAAEAQMIATNFRTVWLFVGAHQAGWSSPAGQTQLSLLISGLLLSTRADRLFLASWDQESGKELVGYSQPSEAKLIWTPLQSLCRLMGPQDAAKVQTVVIDPGVWWVSQHGASDRQQLGYLERRTAAGEARPGNKKNTPRRRSLFRPWGR